jgi:lipoprotein-releasing system permease protein
VGLGDTVSFISPVSLEKKDFRVSGIFNSGMYLHDTGLVLTSLQGAQDFFRAPGYVTSLAVRTADSYAVEVVRQRLLADFSPGVPFEVRTWVDANRNFLEALKLEKTVMFIVVTMTTVVAAFGIVSTLIMSVMSKIKDIGILRSVGARTAGIMQVFVFQGISIGVTGIALGVVGGVTFARSLNRIIAWLSHLTGREIIPRDVYYFDRIPTYLGVGDVSYIVLSALVITLLASVYPALYASRINPAEALRHE